MLTADSIRAAAARIAPFVRRTHEAGFDYHLVKPADLQSLQTILFAAESGQASVH